MAFYGEMLGRKREMFAQVRAKDRQKLPVVLTQAEEVPVKPLAVRLRDRIREALKATDFKLYCTIPAKAWRKPWNVDARPVGRDTAFGYFARYIQKTALDAARILNVTDTHVIIAWTDRESGKPRTTTDDAPGAIPQRVSCLSRPGKLPLAAPPTLPPF